MWHWEWAGFGLWAWACLGIDSWGEGGQMLACVVRPMTTDLEATKLDGTGSQTLVAAVVSRRSSPSRTRQSQGPARAWGLVGACCACRHCCALFHGVIQGGHLQSGGRRHPGFSGPDQTASPTRCWQEIRRAGQPGDCGQASQVRSCPSWPGLVHGPFGVTPKPEEGVASHD